MKNALLEISLKIEDFIEGSNEIETLDDDHLKDVLKKIILKEIKIFFQLDLLLIFTLIGFNEHSFFFCCYFILWLIFFFIFLPLGLEIPQKHEFGHEFITKKNLFILKITSIFITLIVS